MGHAALAVFARTLSLSLFFLCFAAAAAQEKPQADQDDAQTPPLQQVVLEKPEPGAGGVPRAIGFQPAPPAARHVEQMPEFPGGEAALKAYLRENLQYPAKALEDKVQGTVVVEFDVEVDGKLRNVLVLKDIGGGCAAEAVRLVRQMPPWQPGRERGEAVKVTYSLKVDFSLDQWRKGSKTRR